MKHNHITQHFLAYIENRLDGDTRADLTAHLSACENCRAEFQNTEALVSSLRAIPRGLQRLPGRPATRWVDIQARLSPLPRWEPVAIPAVISSGNAAMGFSQSLGNWRPLLAVLLLSLGMLFSVSLTTVTSDLQLQLPQIAVPAAESIGTPVAGGVTTIESDGTTAAFDITATQLTGTPEPEPAATVSSRQGP